MKLNSDQDITNRGLLGNLFQDGALPAVGLGSESKVFTLQRMTSSSSSFSTSTSEISSSEWSSVTPSSMGLNDNEGNFVQGVMGYYETDSSKAPKMSDPDWAFVKVTWSQATNTFTWTNRAGVSWTLTPVSGAGGWDNTKLMVGKDNPYFLDGYTSAKIEWVSYDFCALWMFFQRKLCQISHSHP